MKCLNRTFFKKELEEYAKVLGSEAAAYYLLAINEGNEVENDPNGNPSKLWEDILNYTNGDREKAIEIKAAYYSQQYLSSDNWLDNEVIQEPVFDASNIPMYSGKVEDHILGNNEYDMVTSQLHSIGNQDLDYAARVAIDRSRRRYIDEQQTAFEEDYKNKQTKKPSKFYEKVLQFFNSIYNKGKIKNPSSKDKQNARKRAFNEFNETLRHLIISETIGVLRRNNNIDFSKFLSTLYDNQNFYNISKIYKILNKLIDRDLHIPSVSLIESKEDASDVFYILKNTNKQLYETGIQLFGNINNIHEAFVSNNTSAFNQQQLDYLSNFNDEFINATSSKELEHLVLMYENQDSEMLYDNKKIYDDIKNGLKSRLESIRTRQIGTSKNVVYNIKSRLNKLDKLDPDNPNDAYIIYNDFLETAAEELIKAKELLRKFKENSKDISPSQFTYIKSDIIGYYSYILNQSIPYITSASSGLTNDQIEELKTRLNDIQNIIDTAKSEFYEALESWSNKFVKDIYRKYINVGNEEQFIKYMELAIKNQIDRGYVSSIEKSFGDANKSRSVIVRAIQHILNNDDRETQRNFVKKRNKLLYLYKNSKSILQKLGISVVNPMKALCEMDKNNLPTGFFVREVNYGQFEADKKQFEKSLRKKYRLQEDNNGNTIWNFDISGTEDLYNSYMDELDDWLDERCNRQYTAEYYKIRRRILSRSTIEKIDEISSQIRLLKEKCTDDNGNVYVNKLSQQERTRLEGLKKELQELGNPYSIVLDSNGYVLQLTPKTGEAYDTAMEIMEWNELMRDNVTRIPDYERYKNALDSITDPVQRSIFEYYNSSQVIDPQFYELLKQCSTATQTEEYYRIMAFRNKIMSITKDKYGYYSPNLLKLNEQAWKEIHYLEQRLQSVKITGEKGNVEFDEIAVQLPVMMEDPNNPGSKISVFEYLKQKAQAAMLVNPNAMVEFENTFYVNTHDKHGNLVRKPLSVFFYTAPINPQFISNVPIGDYTKISHGTWVNQDYDQNNKERYQPKKNKYRNKQYEKIQKDPNLKEFYDYIISTMKEAISMLSGSENISEYRMPQITAGSSDILGRFLAKGNVTKALSKSFGQHFVVNETDTELYREDLALMPDGTPVNSISRRFIKPLEDPSKISCDIVASVALFYKMADNFSRKSKSVPEIELLMHQMRGKENVTNNQIERAEQVLKMYGYGKMQSGLGDETKKMTSSQSIATKILNTIRTVGNKALLAGNLFSAAKGAVSSYYQTWSIAVAGRQYDVGDRLWTMQKLLKEFPKAIYSIGRGNTKSIVQAAMQYNGLADDSSSFSNMYRSWIRRMITEHFSMWAFTLGDYNTNAIIMMSTYHATRLMKIPNTENEYQFMTEEQCIQLYNKLGKSEYEAIRDFDRASNRHLFKMYELDKEGNFVLKDKVTLRFGKEKVEINPKDVVTKELEDKISGGISDRAAVANGVANQKGLAPIYSSTIKRLVVVMRGYLLSIGWDRLKTGNDFDVKYYDKGDQRNFGIDSSYRGQFNFESGHIEPGVVSSLFECIKHAPSFLHDLSIELLTFKRFGIGNKSFERKMNKQDLQNFYTALMDIVGVAMFLSIGAMLILGIRKGDVPEEWWSYALTHIVTGCAIESSTPISPTTVLDLFNTVTTIYSFIKDVSRFTNYTKQMLGLSDDDITDNVTSGGYKYKPIWFRDLMKIVMKPTGLTGYYETFTPSIEGLDSKKSKYLKPSIAAKTRLKNNDIDYMLSGKGLKDIQEAYTTPMGPKGKLNWYMSNAFPATMLPKVNEDNKKNKKGIKKPKKKGYFSN